MSDRSGLIRHPLNVIACTEATLSRIAWLRAELAEAEDELRQYTKMQTEMWGEAGYAMTWNELKGGRGADEVIRLTPEVTDGDG